MMAAAFKESWRTPIMFYSLFEKAFMMFLAISNSSQPYSEGFFIPAGMDAFIAVYSILLRKKNIE